jgi:hypothetical protein
MRASLILCDYASQDLAAGKVHMIGAGWSVTGSRPTPQAVAAFIKVGWTEANEAHKLVLRLMDGDGNTVGVPGPAGSQGLEFTGNLEVGRPPGLPQGSEIDATFIMNLSPLPLTPGQRYTWVLEIDDTVQASEGFFVRNLPPSHAAPEPGASG